MASTEQEMAEKHLSESLVTALQYIYQGDIASVRDVLETVLPLADHIIRIKDSVDADRG